MFGVNALIAGCLVLNMMHVRTDFPAKEGNVQPMEETETRDTAGTLRPWLMATVQPDKRGSNMGNKNLDAAVQYLKKGYSVIPLNPSENDDIGKKPFIPWTEFQKRKPTENEIISWWAKWPSAMIGLICGQISGFMVMDTDNQEQDKELQSYFPDNLVMPIAMTPRGGKHYYFKYADGVRNSNGTSGYAFHVRGEGGYIVAPPSERTRKGKYQWIGGLDLEHASLVDAPMQLIKILLKIGRAHV